MLQVALPKWLDGRVEQTAGRAPGPIAYAEELDELRWRGGQSARPVQLAQLTIVAIEREDGLQPAGLRQRPAQ